MFNLKGLFSLVLAVLFLIPAAGCSSDMSDLAPSQSLAVSSPSPASSRPSMFGETDESGDIEIYQWYLDKLEKKEFAFDYVPTVLIYHTHTREAFRIEEGFEYEETSEFRTTDSSKNVIELGRVLMEQLEGYGFNVIHDTTDLEGESTKGAYTRSLEMMESYEDIDLYIDLHRNAADVEKASDDVVFAQEIRCARMFFVVGVGIGTETTQFPDTVNDWETNYSLALQLNEYMQEQLEGIVKPVRTKADRYNQHMGLCLLVEIGHNANTLQDALNSVPYLAEALKTTVTFPN